MFFSVLLLLKHKPLYSFSSFASLPEFNTVDKLANFWQAFLLWYLRLLNRSCDKMVFHLTQNKGFGLFPPAK